LALHLLGINTPLSKYPGIGSHLKVVELNIRLIELLQVKQFVPSKHVRQS